MRCFIDFTLTLDAPISILGLAFRLISRYLAFSHPLIIQMETLETLHLLP